MEFVNRHVEMGVIRRALTERTPCLARVYGRRRLGKTEMLGRLCRELGGLYLLVDDADAATQRDSLSRQIAEHGLGTTVFPSWDSFFLHLPSLKRPFIVLDEAQHLLEADRSAVSRLQHRWDSRMSKSGPSIVICGSVVGLMERMVRRKAAPLFGRLMLDLKVRPFGYAATRLLYPGMGELDRIRRFAVFGGTPFYHIMSVNRELRPAIEESFFREGAALVDEPESLLRLELRRPARYNSIMLEIGQGTHDLRELETKIQVKKGGLSPYLAVLCRDMDLVRLDEPVCGLRKRARYVFTDPFFSFYYREVYRRKARRPAGQQGMDWKTIESALDSHVGPWFEAVVREALVLLNGRTLGSSKIDFYRVGRWWNRTGEEIDVVAEGDNEIIAGEVKWSPARLDLAVLGRLQQKVAMMESLEGRSVRLLLATAGRIRPELAERAGQLGAVLLDLDTLTRIFEGAAQTASGLGRGM